VWQADCHGYYRSPSGRIVTQWPHSMSEFRERASKRDEGAYEVPPEQPLDLLAAAALLRWSECDLSYDAGLLDEYPFVA
jgi:hypothetical protein